MIAWVRNLIERVPFNELGTLGSNVKYAVLIYLSVLIVSIVSAVAAIAASLIIVNTPFAFLYFLLPVILVVGILLLLGLYVLLAYRLLAPLPRFNLLPVIPVAVFLIALVSVTGEGGWVALLPNLPAVITVAMFHGLFSSADYSYEAGLLPEILFYVAAVIPSFLMYLGVQIKARKFDIHK